MTKENIYLVAPVEGLDRIVLQLVAKLSEDKFIEIMDKINGRK